MATEKVGSEKEGWRAYPTRHCMASAVQMLSRSQALDGSWWYTPAANRASMCSLGRFALTAMGISEKSKILKINDSSLGGKIIEYGKRAKQSNNKTYDE